MAKICNYSLTLWKGKVNIFRRIERMRKKNILITGATGFIGSNLINKLLDANFSVFGVARTKSKNKNVSRINILNFNDFNKFVKSKKIDICIHIAGISTVEEGQTDPYKTFRENILGALNVLESARLNNLEKIIVTSSSHVYGKNKVPYYESYPIKTSRPYETSKASVDLIAQSYADTFNLPVLIPRFVNIYGPGDRNLSRLIPKTITTVAQNKNPELWGGKVMRDFIYIDDVIEAYKLLIKIDIKKVGSNRIFNFGTGKLIDIKEVMNLIIEMMNSSLEIKHIDPLRINEIANQYLSVSKSKKILKWTSKIDLKTGLRKTIDWYNDQLKSQQ